MQEAEERAVQFIETGEDSREMFHLIEETFNGTPGFIEINVIVAFHFAVCPRWNNRGDAKGRQVL